MTDINPYAAPQTVETPEPVDGMPQDQDFMAHKRLRRNSIIIYILGAWWALSLAVYLLHLAHHRHDNGIVQVLVTIFSLCNVYAAWMRPSSGGPWNFLGSLVSLLSFPVGTIVGAFGLMAIVQSAPRMYGPHRFQHGANSAQSQTVVLPHAHPRAGGTGQVSQKPVFNQEAVSALAEFRKRLKEIEGKDEEKSDTVPPPPER